MRCPFCFSEKEPEAPVCPTCCRDTAVPEALRKEYDHLLNRRDLLRDELARKETRLAARRRLLRTLSGDADEA
jgi:hypothetical protein